LIVLGELVYPNLTKGDFLILVKAKGTRKIKAI
jgi:hypothetical protein